ncbi:hypothetical protein [Vulcanococcus limneticus]|uniref:hypothetical protein n=1 Tax=Vulcanococcus limneticus TaxID=2170428 RepID=UPI00398BE4F2
MSLAPPRPLGPQLRAALLRWPLPATCLALALLLLLPLIGLRRQPRSNAAGLQRLLSSAALLQSFGTASGQPLPELWSQRLGAARAQQLWQRQPRLWWQFWGAHADAGAYLVLPAELVAPRPTSPLPSLALRLDDLVVVAPDPLALQLLQQQLKVRQRAPQGLEQRCVALLGQREAVLWNGAALGQMLGPLAPLALALQQGCLGLDSRGGSLVWQGEASGTAGLLSAAPPVPALGPRQPLAGPVVLELAGRRLGLLTQGLLASQLLREPLAQRYGLGPAQLPLLQRTPFVLRLREQPTGPFQAGLELELAVGPDRGPWLEVLARTRKALLDQGLLEQESGASGQQLQRPGPATSLPVSTWQREDGTVVGGWRWSLPRGGGSAQQPRLLLSLGPVPAVTAQSPGQAAQGTDAGAAVGAAGEGSTDLILRLRPAALARLGLLPEALPPLVRRASQVELLGLSAPADRRGSTGPQLGLAGRLELGR